MISAAPTLARNEVALARITMPKPRGDAIARPALDAELELALARARLVLLCAAAGYGKTTALVQALSRAVPGLAHAWVSVSEDDDLPSLLACLLAALDPLDLPWRQSPDEWPSLVLTEQGSATVVAALHQALEHAGVAHGVIVLDDLHRLADGRAYSFLNLLIARLPARWTLAVTSRQPPPLALGRLRLHGELAEFGEAQLRFGPPELRVLLSRQAPQADDDSAEQLYRATQGWPVGAMTMRKLPDGGALQGLRDRRWRLFDYLATEVLNELPPPMREFLLRCSVLRELSAERCAHVSGDARAAHWLDELECRGLFVSVLDAEDQTLRLHDLFREFLQARLLVEHADEHARLLLRAAEGEPDFARRIGLLLRGGAADRALADVMAHAVDILLGGADAQLLRVIEQFPADMRDTAPELAFARGLCAWHRFRFQTMAQVMQEAAVGFERWRQPILALQASAFAIIALHYGGRGAEAGRLWRETANVSGDGPTPAAMLADYTTSLMCGPASATTTLLWRLVNTLSSSSADLRWFCFLVVHIAFGRWGLRPPMEALARVLADAANDDHPRLKATAMLCDAGLALWRGDLAKVHALREPLERESAWLDGTLTLKLPLQYLLAIERHITGHTDAARSILQQISGVAQTSPERRSPVLYRQIEAAFASANGDWAVAQALQTQLAALDQPWPILPYAHAALDAEVALQRGDAKTAANVLRPLLGAVADVDSYGTHTRLRLALARAEQQCGDAHAAWQVLQPALEEVRSSGETLGFLMVGPAALDELATAAWPASAEPALLVLLEQIAADAHRLRSGAADAPPEVKAPVLSERERQVLKLIAEGRSNKLIARELGLSPHTVKRHVARILERTGQASRTSAAAWYGQHAAGLASKIAR